MYSQLSNIFQQQQQQQSPGNAQTPANYYTSLINTPGFINLFNNAQHQQQQGQASPKVTNTMNSPTANNSSSASSSSSISSTSSSNTSLTEKNKLRTIGGVLYNNNNSSSAPGQLYSLVNANSESMNLPTDSKDSIKNTANALIRVQQQAGKQQAGKTLR